ncbi:TlpA family protein disulfide reductase [Formosa sp. S-31]|uniref:TlpA family protein disulfide reductase n=1 Tax=Formosa sp. S-31 TaxID=2790949 RepID=UPI003EB698E0
MKKTLFALGALSIFACQQAPKEIKDYASLSGKISNKNSDSLLIRSRTYNKTIKVNEDGTFSDTLKVEAGLYNFFDGTESTTIFLKNGYDLNISLDTKTFDESLKYTGEGANDNNFLAEKSLLQEKLFDQDFSTLDMDGLDKAFNDIESELTKFYASKTEVDSLAITPFTSSLPRMLDSYKKYYAGAILLRQEMAGKPSPEFTDYENIDGTKTSLADLKGKYVYVDVWATWCGPCKAEIPSLKALEKEYHGKNIAFVSMSVDDDRTHGGSWDKAKEDWKAMVADKELSGIQIMAPEGWKSQFVQDYKITGIPRFILIDPAGNVVDPSAPRPSDEKIKEIFNALSI